MSTDITTTQISKDVPKSPTVSEVNTTQVNAARQNVAVEDGKSLPPEEAVQAKPDREELQEAVAQLNQHIQQIQRDLLFSVDDSSGRTVVQVVNSETDEIVRQIPSEDVLRILRNLQEQMDSSSGLIFETSA